jgi:hypothetical protein
LCSSIGHYLPSDVAGGRLLDYRFDPRSTASLDGNTYYLMDPATWTCSTGTFTGGPPAGPTNPYLHGKWQYSPSLDIAVVIIDVGANVRRVLSLALAIQLPVLRHLRDRVAARSAPG